VAALSIDDVQVAAGVPPLINANPISYHALFGAAAGTSSSNTDLDYFCYNTTPNSLLVTLDIKPGTLVNSINTKSRGKIPVAVLSTATFDASTRIDPASLTFGRTGNEDSLSHCSAERRERGQRGGPRLPLSHTAYGIPAR
jgi:hypothetical protein